jgi:hypothetical protein
MKTFIYKGSSVIRITISEKEYTLISGGVYELPEKNTYISSLVRQDILKPVRKKK